MVIVVNTAGVLEMCQEDRSDLNFHHTHTRGDRYTGWFGVIISQCKHLSKHQAVYIKIYNLYRSITL